MERHRACHSTRASTLQTEHVLHVVQTARTAGEPLRSAHCADGEVHPTSGAMRDLDPFTGAGEHHRVFTDDVTGANRLETDRLAIARPGDALSAVHRVLGEIAIERLRENLAHLECGARRRVDLAAVV